MTNVRIAVGVLMVSMVLSFGCASNKTGGKAESDKPRTTEEVDGRVLEVLNTGRYKYVRVKTEDGKIWVATTACSVKAGEDVTVPPGFMMSNLKSLVLKRTFDEVCFVDALGAEAEAMASKSAKMPAGHPPTGGGKKASMPAGHSQAGSMPSGHPKTGGMQKSTKPLPFPGKTVTGTVREVIHASRYTYVRIEDGDKDVWAAAPKFKVEIGDRATAPLGMPMKDFKSSRLKRTFDMVYFTSRIDLAGSAKD